MGKIINATGKFIGTATGLKYTASAASRAIDNVKTSANGAYEAAWGWKNREIRHEQFEESVERQGLTDDDLSESLREKRISAKLYLALAFICLLSMGWGAFHDDIFRFVAAAFMGFMFLTLAAKWAFRAWQITERRLGGWREWLGDAGNWTRGL